MARGRVPPDQRRAVPKRLVEGSWLLDGEGPTEEDLRGQPTVIVRWRAGDLVSIATLLAAQVDARRHGARVIGLHVPGQPSERAVEHVQDAVIREGIHAPIRLDTSGEVAGALGLTLAPSYAVLDAEARIAMRAQRAPDASTWRGIDDLRGKGQAGADRWPMRGPAPGPHRLLHPQGVATSGTRLAIADTAHDRILLHTPGQGAQAIGEGAPGDRDGPLERARFSRPRGLAVTEEGLLVADTGNHAIRRVDLEAERVDTLVPAHELGSLAGSTGTVGPMPWSIATHAEGPEAWATLAAGRAVVHLDTATGEVEVLGGGGQGRALVQPTGLAWGADRVYVSDPLRGTVHARGWPAGTWRTIATSRSGPLAFPAGLALDRDGTLWVADPYAGRLHRIDPDGSLAGGIELAPKGRPTPAPWALAADGGTLIVAADDHRVDRVDPATGSRRPVELGPIDEDEPVVLDPVEAAPDARLELELAVHGAGSEPEPERPVIHGPVQIRTLSEPAHDGEALRVEVTARLLGHGDARVRWRIDGEAGREAAWRVPVIVRPGGDERVEIRLATAWPSG